MTNLREELKEFIERNKFHRQGALCVALVVTEHARKRGLPLDPEKLLSESGGQVLGLGKAAVQKILERHGISRVLANEGGRTSRGSIEKMRQYVGFLNDLNMRAAIDLNVLEEIWIEQVQAFFQGKPFQFNLDPSRSLRSIVRDLLDQAKERQRVGQGTMYVGTVLQHLVGAKLDYVLGGQGIEHHSSSTADAPSGRSGDFIVEDTVVHVTSSPSEAVIARCRENLNENYRPLLITIAEGMPVAEGLARQAGIDDRIDIFEVEQFIATNLYEKSHFATAERRITVTDLIECYNNIIDKVETDHSLKAELPSGGKSRRT